MTPQAFIAKWGPGGPSYGLNERQGAQPHFIDLCQLLGVPLPGSEGDYIFEQDALVLGAARGYADVFYRNHFAWENKAPGKNLDEALKQLLTYSLALSNPPLLVVCDRLTTRIHTQFNGHPSEVHTVRLDELDQPEKQALLRRLWTDPESFRPKKTSRDITEAAAKSFATLAEGLRKRGPSPAWVGAKPGPHEPEVPKSVQALRQPAPDALKYADEVAHFLTQCLFCFFAEDVGLLPGRMFEGLVNNKNLTSDRLTAGLTNLFTVMRDGGLYGNDDIPWFNGGLFKRIQVPPLTIMEVTELRNAAALNWSAIDVSIFGTLFERGLDPSKRSQLGAHYTDPATILRIIEPVLIRPLLQKWEQIAQEIKGLMTKSTRKNDKQAKLAMAKFAAWLEDLKAYRVLDPACGSGNFLFLGLKALKDIEHKSHLDAAAMGLDRQADLVTGPHNVLGIELNEYAAELARVTVWIGELQWRIEHGYEFKTNPVLEPLDHIECRDALITFKPVRPELNTVRPELVEGLGADSAAGARQHLGPHEPEVPKSTPNAALPLPRSDLRAQRMDREEGSDRDFAQQNSGSDPSSLVATEAPWPKASVVIGNPPFLGGSKKRRELGDDYFEELATVFKDRVPAGADLVCYWFDKARLQIANAGLGAAGLVSTQSIRAGSNRKVLEAIATDTKIFDAWSDESWVNEGAAVRVSLICFGWGAAACLDGINVDVINADLTSDAGADMTSAKLLFENAKVGFEGTKKYGDFDIPGELARQWLMQPNPHGQSNAEVVKPWRNGQDLTKRPSDTWIIDFGTDMAEVDASLYEAPFTHTLQKVKPERLKVRRERTVRLWWLHEEARVSLRRSVSALHRYLATPRVSKYRFFVFLDGCVLPDTRLNIITRADDSTFGVLSSRIHEVWSLAQASMHGVGNDPTYNAKSCFETFPFPAGLTPADTAHQRTETLQGGAIIPAGLAEGREGGWAARGSAQVKEEPAKRAGDTEQNPLPPSHPKSTHNPTTNRGIAVGIANAAKRLNDLREAWLNPPEWTVRVPEVTPLGMTSSPYPDRILPKAGHEKDLAERTLTKLYNQRPAWLDAAHQALDLTVAQAYGWSDYTNAMPEEEILLRLLALNLERSNNSKP